MNPLNLGLLALGILSAAAALAFYARSADEMAVATTTQIALAFLGYAAALNEE